MGLSLVLLSHFAFVHKQFLLEWNGRQVDCFLKPGAYITHNATEPREASSGATKGFRLIFSCVQSFFPRAENTR